MSRFSNLEFGGYQEDQNAWSRPEERGEQYYLNQADAAFEDGRFEQSLRLYSKVLEYAPNSVAAWAGQVRMLVELGEFREAKLWADKALERFPEDAELMAAKAVALGRSGDLAAALIFSDSAIEAKGDKPYVWLARGDVLLARREKRAAFCFDRALSLAAGDWVIHWMVCRIHLFYEQFARALKFAQQAVALNTTRAAVWLDMGRCQQALGLVGPAQNSYIQARQLDPACEAAGLALLRASQLGLGARLRGLWRQLCRG